MVTPMRNKTPQVLRTGKRSGSEGQRGQEAYQASMPQWGLSLGGKNMISALPIRVDPVLLPPHLMEVYQSRKDPGFINPSTNRLLAFSLFSP